MTVTEIKDAACQTVPPRVRSVGVQTDTCHVPDTVVPALSSQVAEPAPKNPLADGAAASDGETPTVGLDVADVDADADTEVRETGASPEDAAAVEAASPLPKCKGSQGSQGSQGRKDSQGSSTSTSSSETGSCNDDSIGNVTHDDVSP